MVVEFDPGLRLDQEQVRGLKSVLEFSAPVTARSGADRDEHRHCPWGVFRKVAARHAALLPALGLTGWAALPATPAAAGHFVGATGSTADCGSRTPGGVNMTDNSTWVWNYHDLAQDTLQALEWARVTIFDPTDMTTSVTEDPSSNTDMVAYDRDYTDYCGLEWDGASRDIWGLTSCVSVLSNSRCNRHEVRYDLPDMQGQASSADKVGLACHESGHAVGFAHLDNSADLDAYRGCMYTYGPYKDYLSTHDIESINAIY